MYEKLISSLRICQGMCEGAGFEEAAKLLTQAADAIEKLMNISNFILLKYKMAAETVIWEYSGKITEDMAELLKEVDNYKSQINGEPEPSKENEHEEDR